MPFHCVVLFSKFFIFRAFPSRMYAYMNATKLDFRVFYTEIQPDLRYFLGK